ncbi:hypothetical protein KUTeg_024274 [Tegillarca granosa]|uniref:Uncharacterized protein n=1 Tax=Tegillarca granosa TaxID=220873 RepID=A0ABQ9DWV7_TEGGR|nr:hypothetical protein KUTeg_024274 [Tegillarca granosa]
MDEDTEGIEALIEQRSQRHGYVRMISWEFPTDPVSHRKKRKSGRNKSGETVQSEGILQISDDENQSVFSKQSDDFKSDLSLTETNVSESDSFNDLSDSDSFYVSAEEDVEEEDSDLEGHLSSFSYLKLKGIEDIDIGTSTNNQEDSAPRTSDHQKAPSKKQKRKARRSFRVLYGDRFLPLKDIDLALDVTEIQSQSQDLAVTVIKQVPTLLELCLRASNKKIVQGSVPCSIRNILKESQLDKATRNHQITWFQGILAYCEAHFEHQFVHKKPVDIWKILLPLRNIWNTENYFKHMPNPYMSQPAYIGSKQSSYLLCTHIIEKEWIKIPFNYNEKENLYLITYCLFGVLACLVDLMMPPVVSANLKKKSANEETQMAHSVKRVVQRVKHVIKSRFPKIVDHIFNEVLPYVYWARGNLPAATESFTELAQNDKRCRYKAFYLSEIGRMYGQYNLVENATKSYRLAAELATQKNPSLDSEVNGQMMILCANVYDQGLMTIIKGKQALSTWKSVLFCPDVKKEDVVNVLVDSMLCFHSGCWADYDSQWLESARDQLTFLTSTCPQLFYPLSMVHALLGL